MIRYFDDKNLGKAINVILNLILWFQQI